MKPTTCECCGGRFIPTSGPHKRRPAQRFCSPKCAGSGRAGVKHWSYKGGSINKQGYRIISIAGRRILEHRHVMEQHLGRPLLPSEVVHHKDHDRLNNAIENLQLVESQARHRLLHYTGYRTETHKQCRKCRRVKPRTEYDAGCKKPGRDPNHTECKECRAAYYAERWRRRMEAEGTVGGPPSCSRCGTILRRRPPRSSSSEHHFCSPACRQQWKRDRTPRREERTPKAEKPKRVKAWGKRGEVACKSCGKADSPCKSRGTCTRCYDRTRRSGCHPRKSRELSWDRCSAPCCANCHGTDSPPAAKGLCRRCYGRMWRRGPESSPASR